MSAAKPDPFDDSLLLWRERKRVFDAVWLTSLTVVSASLAVPWFLRVMELDLTRVAWSIFVYTLVYLALASATNRLHQRTYIVISACILQVSSVLFLAFLWHLVGGLDHPMFLLIFILPVITSGIILPGWWPHAIALSSVLPVVGVALLESPELRWYLSQLGVPVNLVAQVFPVRLPLQAHPFRGLETGPAYQLTVLEMFVVLQFTVALMSTTLAMLVLRLHGRLQISVTSLKESQSLFQAVLSASPEPGLIVYADSGQVVHATSSFFKRMLVVPEDIIGKGIFEVIAFAQPERLRGALEAERGVVPFCVYRVGAEARVANFHVHRAEHEGNIYTYVGWQELTDVYYLNAAFNAVGDPLLGIGTDKRLLYFNLAAQELFGSLYFGMETQGLPAISSLLDEGRRQQKDEPWRRPMDISDHPYEVSGRAVRLPGEADACTVLWLRSLAQEEVLSENEEN